MSYNGCTKKFDVDQYVARHCGTTPKNWKFKVGKGKQNNGGGAADDSRRQPVKVFVPSKTSRRKWTY